MKIGIDIDDTISNTYDVLFHYAQRYTIEDLHRSGEIKNLRNLTTHMYCRQLHDWSKAEEMDFLDKYYETVIRKVQPKLFVKNILDKLKDREDELILITARFDSKHFDVEQVTKKWLQENKIPYDKLYLNADRKDKIAKEEKIDFFIDDSFSNCERVANLGIKTFLMDSKVNEQVHTENLTRVYSWPHVYQEIEKQRNN